MACRAALVSLLLLVLLPLALGGPVIDIVEKISELKAAKFQKFLTKHNLFFPDAKEKAKRLSIFAKNLDRIDELNAKKAGGEDVQFGENQFTHLTFEEFNAMMLFPSTFNASAHNKHVAKPNLGRIQNVNRTAGFHSRHKRQSLPTSMDWRQYGVIPPVRNQGGCGSCWAFTSAGVSEISYALQFGTIPDFAEQELVNCATANYGCNGGWVDTTLDYMKTNGLHYEPSMPYSGTDGTCPSSISGGKLTIYDYDDLTGYTEEQMKEYLYWYGPFSCGFGVGDAFQHYVSGVFNPSSCPGVNHVMIVVGYGTSGGVPYWLIRNSWSTGWGESGYVKVVRNVNKCGVATMNYSPWF
jgi:cathepsin H